MKSPYSWSGCKNSNIGFAQQHNFFGCVQICVFGDGVQGKERAGVIGFQLMEQPDSLNRGFLLVNRKLSATSGN